MEKQRAALWVGSVILVVFICVQTSLPTAVLAFLVLGIIPGTHLSVPAWAILLVYPALIALGLSWLHNQAFFIGERAPTPKSVSKATKTTASNPKKTVRKKVTPAKRRVRTAT